MGYIFIIPFKPEVPENVHLLNNSIFKQNNYNCYCIRFVKQKILEQGLYIKLLFAFW